MTLRRRLLTATAGAALTVLAVALTGCGVSTGGPASVPKGQVPFNLLDQNPPTTTTTTPPNPNDYYPFNVYLANVRSQLVPSPRVLRTGSHLADAIDNLLGPVTQAEVNNGLLTYLGSVHLLDVSTVNTLTGPLVTVDLSASFAAISGTAEVLAAGQLVLTVTEFEKAPVAVQFEVEGAQIDVATGNGSQAFAPVHASDYVNLLAPGAAAP